MNQPNNVTENVVSVFGCSQAGCENNGYESMNGSEIVCILEPQPDDYLSTWVLPCVYSIIFLLALIGNGLVCFVVLSSPRMKTVTNFFIMSLAVGDILMTLFCIPFTFVSTLILRYWPFGELMCTLVTYSQAVSVLVSAYTLSTISVDRCFVITRPLKPRIEKKTAKLVIYTVWGGALATAAPILIVSQLEKPSLWHQVCDLYVCSEKWTYPGQNEHYTCALLILQFALPLTTLIFSYGCMAYKVCNERPPGEADIVRDMRIHQSKRKMIKMMITIVVIFAVCWLPLNIFNLLYKAHEYDDYRGRRPRMPYGWFISHCLAMSHSCFNPIIYCYMNERYRREFVQKNNDKAIKPVIQ
ncbi:RYamide receptor-like [Nymphalis io]|uniref:RYamide receptor-like n=1 Tax=Inachis io TaxID=171585 RepID=UPI0021690192|nr:RYamide receptor-like [Nymphalis io]